MSGPREAYRLRACLGFVAAAVAALGLCIPDYGSVAYSFLWKRHYAGGLPADARIATPALQSMLCPPGTRDSAQVEEIRTGLLSNAKTSLSAFEVALVVNDGLKLLAGKFDERSRIFTLDYSNPFPFALQLPPLERAPVAWEAGFWLDDVHHPPAEAILRDVTHVMVPKAPMLARTSSFADACLRGVPAGAFRTVGRIGFLGPLFANARARARCRRQDVTCTTRLSAKKRC